MKSPRIRVPVAVLVALVSHLTFLRELRVAGVQADGPLLLAVAAGIVGGAEWGAIVGFLGGVAIDLFLLAPFGLSALTLCLVGFAVGSVQSGILRSTWWIPVLTTLVSSTAGVVLYALIGTMVGLSALLQARLLATAALVGAMNAAFALLAVRLATWSLRGDPDRSFARA